MATENMMMLCIKGPAMIDEACFAFSYSALATIACALLISCVRVREAVQDSNRSCERT